MELAKFWLTKAADQGYQNAKDFLQSLQITSNVQSQPYTSLIEPIDAVSQCNLAFLYYCGSGVPQSFTDAIKWYRKAAEQNFPRAQYALGFLYDNGIGVEKDLQLARYWYQKAADKQAQVSSSADTKSQKQGHESINFQSNLVNSDPDEKLIDIHNVKEAQRGDADAQYILGRRYFDGYNIIQSFEEAVNWYKKAAEQEHPWALLHLGQCYQFGTGVEKNEKLALHFYQRSAYQGNEVAANRLAIFHEGAYKQDTEKGPLPEMNVNGKLIKQPLTKMQMQELKFHHYNKTNLMREINAKVHNKRENNAKVQKKSVSLMHIVRKQAYHGNAIAQFQLATCYYYGNGLQQNRSRAEYCYRKAAEQGNADAQSHLDLIAKTAA